MRKLLAARLVRLLFTLFAVTLLSFLMTSLLPGDPAVAILGQDGIQNAELLAELQEDLGLNDPLPVRYVNWLATRSDSIWASPIPNRGQSVADTIRDRLPVTAQLAFMAIIIAIVLAVPIGVIGAYKQGRWPDKASSAAVQVALRCPISSLASSLFGCFPCNLDGCQRRTGAG